MNCEGDHEIHCMNFNQDGSSLSAGCKSGFYLYGLSNATEKLDVSFEPIEKQPIHWNIIFRIILTPALKTLC